MSAPPPVRGIPPAASDASTRPPPSVGRRVHSSRRRYAVALLAVVVAVALVRTTLVGAVRIDSSSMSPTLRAGDVVLVTRRAPALADLGRGDLVVFAMPTDGTTAVKRVVGLPGEHVVVLDGELHVDGVRVPEPYVDHRWVDGSYTPTYVVPPDAVLVMGDNRANSIDSRHYGPVPLDALRGRVLVRLWPRR